jgi:polyphosphate glucokinase
MPGPTTAAIDIGGSGIKTMLLDGAGHPVTERARVATPRPATVEAILPLIAEMLAALPGYDRVGVGFPGVVQDGRTLTAVNLHPSWVGFDLVAALSATLGRPVRAANDADVQGLALIEGRGVELVLTLGTGMGSGLYLDGRLVPNLELGHHPFRKGETYEEQLGDAALERAGPQKWNKRCQRAVRVLERVFNFRRLFLGGGNAAKITVELPEHVVLADNIAGLHGCFYLWEPRDPRT